MQREASKGNVQALGVGRRGASRRARPELAVSAPVGEVPAEKDAPLPHGRRGKVKVPEPIMLNGSEEEHQNELKLEMKEEDAPAQGVVRRGPSPRSRTTPLEPLATRRRDAASSTEERDVPVEAVLVRPTRVRKPTIKAAEAAEGKVPRRTVKKAAPTNSTLQKEKQQENPQEAVPAPLSEEAYHDLENVEEAADPRNLEQSEVIDESRREDEEVVMTEDEILMDETPAEKPPVTNEILMEETLAEEPPPIGECTGNSAVGELECKEKSPLEEETADDEHCSSPLPSQEDSPILGLVSTFAEQTVEKDEDEGAHFQEGSGPSEGRLDKGMDEENHHPGIEMEMVPVIQRLQAPLTAAEPAAAVGFTGHADHGSESSNNLQGTEETATVNAEDGLVCQEKGDVVVTQSKMVDEAVVLDCSGNISLVVEEKKVVETMVSELVQNEVAICINLSQVTLIDSEGAGMEKAEELTQGSAQLDEDVEEDDFQTDFVHVDELKEIVGMEKSETVADEPLRSIATMCEDVGEDSFQTDFIRVDEQKLIVNGEKAELGIDKLRQSIVKMDKGVEEDGFQSVHVDEQKFVVDVEKAQLVTDKLPLSTTTMDEDVEEDFQTDFVHIKEQKKISTTDWVQEVSMNGDIVVEKVLITKETQQKSTATMDEEDVTDDPLETDFVLAEKQKEGATADKVDEEEKVVEINEEMPQSIGTIGECVQEGYFEVDVHADEVKKVATADNVLEVTETEDEDVRKENAFSGDLPRELDDIARDYSYHITSALLDDISESLSKITITEPTASRNEDLPLCKNSSENDTAEPVCKNSSEKNTDEPVHENRSEKNTAEPVEMQENKGAKVSKKSADLNGLSLGQLRTMLKKTLEHKKAKRVALARVDENVCRSNATDQ